MSTILQEMRNWANHFEDSPVMAKEINRWADLISDEIATAIQRIKELEECVFNGTNDVKQVLDEYERDLAALRAEVERLTRREQTLEEAGRILGRSLGIARQRIVELETGGP